MWSANVPATVGSPQVRAAHSADTDAEERERNSQLAATSAARRRFGSASRATERETAWASERYSQGGSASLGQTQQRKTYCTWNHVSPPRPTSSSKPQREELHCWI